MLKPTRSLLLARTALLAAKPPPTHFTSTGPHAQSPPPASQSSASKPPSQRRSRDVDVGTGGRKGETAHERVKRLRAAALKARLDELPWTERALDRSRRILDKAHRVTSWFLVGSAAVIAIVTVYALTDMLMYNRRKKTEYREATQERNKHALTDALQAAAQGTATVKQRILVKRYEAAQAEEAARLAGRSTIGKAVDWMFPGVTAQQNEARLVMRLDTDLMKAIESGEIPAFDPVESLAEEATTDVVVVGGPLDAAGRDFVNAPFKAVQTIAGWVGLR